MPAEYILLPERRLVLTVIHGVTSDTEIIAHAQRLLADPHFHPDLRQFADLSQVAPSPISANAFHAIRGNLNPFRQDAVRAVFAPHDMSFAFSRMFEMLLTDKNMLVTRSREAAERHVGLERGESLALAERFSVCV